LQERSLAEAENKPLPPNYSSSDVRSLNLRDFKHAHEQVNSTAVLIYFLPCQKKEKKVEGEK
jgi:hypothetical protein